MPPVIDSQDRTFDLDRDLETARREVSDLDREETEQQTRRHEDNRRWIQEKAERYRAAMKLYLSIYPIIRQRDAKWRQQVHRGEAAFCQKFDSQLRSLYALWFAYSDMFKEKAEFFERHGVNFGEEMDTLHRSKRESARVIRTWESPSLALSPGSRALSVSAPLAEMLLEPVAAPVSNPEFVRIPMGDPSLIR